MGKKTRKTRWRTLAISGESDSEESTRSQIPKNLFKPYSSKFSFSSQSTPTRRYQHDAKSTRSSSTASESKITFNEDEYTRITTPRQDVLFKKGYLNKPKNYQTQTSTGNSTTSTGNSTGDGTPDHQSADGTEGTDLEYDSQFVFPNAFVDQNGIYYINSYEPYPLVMYNHPMCYPEYPTSRSKRYSTDSLTESTSPHNEETSQEQSQSGGETSANVPEFNHMYNALYPGYYYNNGCESNDIANGSTEPRKVKKKRRRKVSKSANHDEASSSDDCDSSDEEEAISQVENRVQTQKTTDPSQTQLPHRLDEIDAQSSTEKDADASATQDDRSPENASGEASVISKSSPESQEITQNCQLEKNQALDSEDQKVDELIVEEKDQNHQNEEEKHQNEGGTQQKEEGTQQNEEASKKGEEKRPIEIQFNLNAEEFVPRAYRQEPIHMDSNVQFVNIHPNFIPVSLLNPLNGTNYNQAFLPQGIPINFIAPDPKLCNFVISNQAYVAKPPEPQNSTQQEKKIEEIEEPVEEAKKDDVQTEPKINKNDIDIAKIVSKLEEAAKEQKIFENRRATFKKYNRNQKPRYGGGAHQSDFKQYGPRRPFDRPLTEENDITKEENPIKETKIGEMSKNTSTFKNSSPKKYYHPSAPRNYSETLKKSPTAQAPCQRFQRHNEKAQTVAIKTESIAKQTTTSKPPNQWISVSSRKKRKNRQSFDAEIEETPEKHDEFESFDVELLEDVPIRHEEVKKVEAKMVENKMDETKMDVTKLVEIKMDETQLVETQLVETKLVETKIDESEMGENQMLEAKIDQTTKENVVDSFIKMIKKHESSPSKDHEKTIILQDVKDVEKQLLSESTDQDVKKTPKKTFQNQPKKKKGAPKLAIKRVMITDVDMSQENDSKTSQIKIEESQPIIEEMPEDQIVETHDTPVDKKKKKKKKKIELIPPSLASSTATLNNPEDSYDFLLDTSVLEHEKTNDEISEEFDKMIQKGLYTNLEGNIKSLNFPAVGDDFFKSINFKQNTPEKSYIKTIDLSAIMKNATYGKNRSIEMDFSKIDVPESEPQPSTSKTGQSSERKTAPTEAKNLNRKSDGKLRNKSKKNLQKNDDNDANKMAKNGEKLTRRNETSNCENEESCGKSKERETRHEKTTKSRVENGTKNENEESDGKIENEESDVKNEESDVKNEESGVKIVNEESDVRNENEDSDVKNEESDVNNGNEESDIKNENEESDVKNENEESGVKNENEESDIKNENEERDIKNENEGQHDEMVHGEDITKNSLGVEKCYQKTNMTENVTNLKNEETQSVQILLTNYVDELKKSSEEIRTIHTVEEMQLNSLPTAEEITLKTHIVSTKIKNFEDNEIEENDRLLITINVTQNEENLNENREQKEENSTTIDNLTQSKETKKEDEDKFQDKIQKKENVEQILENTRTNLEKTKDVRKMDDGEDEENKTMKTSCDLEIKDEDKFQNKIQKEENVEQILENTRTNLEKTKDVRKMDDDEDEENKTMKTSCDLEIKDEDKFQDKIQKKENVERILGSTRINLEETKDVQKMDDNEDEEKTMKTSCDLEINCEEETQRFEECELTRFKSEEMLRTDHVHNNYNDEDNKTKIDDKILMNINLDEEESVKSTSNHCEIIFLPSELKNEETTNLHLNGNKGTKESTITTDERKRKNLSNGWPVKLNEASTKLEEIRLETTAREEIRNGFVKNDDTKLPKNKLYPITQAVRDWMTKTRENTPEVEILKSPDTIYREFVEEDNESEPEGENPTRSVVSNGSEDEITVFETWDVRHDVSIGQDMVEELDRQIEKGEDVLEVYDSQYGKNEDYLRLKAEVEEQKKGNSPKHGDLPYRAICCNLM